MFDDVESNHLYYLFILKINSNLIYHTYTYSLKYETMKVINNKSLINGMLLQDYVALLGKSDLAIRQSNLGNTDLYAPKVTSEASAIVCYTEHSLQAQPAV